MTPDRRRAERRGRSAEWIAVAALTLKGYRLLARRFKTPLGEVDLIMRRGEVTAFVEVKQRRSAAATFEAVGDKQKRRIAAAARLWASRDARTHAGVSRCDVVYVTPWRWPEHVEDAFR